MDNKEKARRIGSKLRNISLRNEEGQISEGLFYAGGLILLLGVTVAGYESGIMTFHSVNPDPSEYPVPDEVEEHCSPGYSYGKSIMLRENNSEWRNRIEEIEDTGSQIVKDHGPIVFDGVQERLQIQTDISDNCARAVVGRLQKSEDIIRYRDGFDWVYASVEGGGSQ